MPSVSLPVSSPLRLRKTVGIDLGTTNSVIALLDPSGSALITGQDEAGHLTFPSVVGYHPEQKRLVAGHAARELNEPPSPLTSIKRSLGQDQRFAVGPQSLSPPEASAVILRHLRDMLGRILNDPRYRLDSAILTMPASFHPDQVEATRQAGELAGFEVVELLAEPAAAVIYYSWLKNHPDATYIVYDLGGGTFEVSIVQRRRGECQVLGTGGDPHLGGDDLDRLLAAYLLETGTWKYAGESAKVGPDTLASLFDETTSSGAARFRRLLRVAESIKRHLTDQRSVSRFNPSLVQNDEGRALDLEVVVEQSMFHRLIKDILDRTMDCCQETLAQARQRMGLKLRDIDHLVLVGGSSRVPLVRESVQAAFCNPDLAEHVRNPEPFLHQPDLCVAYGAALRGATLGTRYLFPMEHKDWGTAREGRGELELHLTSPVTTPDAAYQATGIVRLRPITPAEIATPSSVALSSFPPSHLEAASVRIRAIATGLIEEVFLDGRGAFAQELELQPEADNALQLTVCNGVGEETARVVVCIRHQARAGPRDGSGLSGPRLTKPWQIEVLNRSQHRVKQVVAPAGAPLPGVFQATCRTLDASGRIVVPIFEENRFIQQLVLDDLEDLPIGSPVEVEFAIDVKYTIEVRVKVRPTPAGERCDTVTIEAPSAPLRPTRAGVEKMKQQIEELLPQFRGGYRTRVQARATQLHKDLLEALHRDDEPRAVQRLAELTELLRSLETSRDLVLDPPWPRFTKLVRHCLDIAAEVAQATGRDPDELFEHIQAQERYADQAYEEHNQKLYRECQDNLHKYAGYLTQLLRHTLPRSAPPTRPPEDEARDAVESFRSLLTAVWKQVRARQRPDLETQLTEIANQARGLSQRVKSDPLTVRHDTHRLSAEIARIEEDMQERPQPPCEDAGLLEGMD
jgi:molecular chaperone DnaK